MEKSLVDLEIEKIKKSLSDGAKKVKDGKNRKEKQYQTSRNELLKVRKLKSRRSNLHLPWRELSDFEDE